MAANTLLGRSPLHAWQAAQGASFAQRHGWWLAHTSPMPGDSGLRLADVTPFAKLAYGGNEALHLSRAFFPDAQPGRMIAAPGEAPGWLAYLSEDSLLFLSTRLDAPPIGIRPSPAQDIVPATWDATSAHAGMLLIGAEAARLVCSQLNLGGGPALLPPGSCAETGFFGVQCLLARPDERTIGLWVAWDVAEYVWERLRAVAPRAAFLGADGLREFGWQA